MSSYSTKRRKILQLKQTLLRSLEIPQDLVPATSSLNKSPDLNFNTTVCTNVVLPPSRNPENNLNRFSNDKPVDTFSQCNNLEQDDSFTLESQLGAWAVKNNVTHNSLSELLKIIGPFVEYPLPLSAKSLLSTPKSVNIVQIDGGKYYFFGVKKFIVDTLENNLVKNFYFPVSTSNNSDLITLTLSTDGIPICKSSSITLWPLLVRIDQVMHIDPFPCAIFCGGSKPSSIHQFMEDVVKELLDITRNGIVVKEKSYRVEISCFVADRPARSFVKCVKGHGGYHSCERCDDEGEYVSNRIVYSTKSGMRRSNISFRAKSDPDHHIGSLSSPMVGLEFDMVLQFSLDYMHLVLLGVVKKLLCMWISGPLTCRLPAKLVTQLSEKLVNCAKYFPVEFQRKPRSLKELSRYKATEFRHFLLYTGPCVLKQIISRDKYLHFLLLHCAMKILLSDQANNPILNKGAKFLLSKFVRMGSKVYGQQFVVFNVHSLLHLADDGITFGNLENVSAFYFENYLQKLKRLVRGKRLHLEQIVRRVNEINNFGSFKSNQSDIREVGVKKSRVVFEKFMLSLKCGNNCFADVYGRVLILKSICTYSNKLFCEVLECRSVDDYPINSINLGVYTVKFSAHPLNVYLNPTDVVDKCMLVPVKPGGNHFYCHLLKIS